MKTNHFSACKNILTAFAVFTVLHAPLAFAADTNIIPSLTISGKTYTNVEIGTVTASHVTIFYEGGGMRVAISNLPPDLQRRFNYDPAEAARQDAVEAQKRAAIKKQQDQMSIAIAKAQSTLGPAQKIRIIKLITESQLQIVLTNGQPAEAYIHNLPYEVITFVRDLNQTEAAVEADKYVQYHDVARSGGNSYYTRQDNKIANQRHLADLEGPGGSHAKVCTTVIACPSAYLTRPGVRQWEYQGMATADFTP
jgi:hypothetical protein